VGMFRRSEGGRRGGDTYAKNVDSLECTAGMYQCPVTMITIFCHFCQFPETGTPMTAARSENLTHTACSYGRLPFQLGNLGSNSEVQHC